MKTAITLATSILMAALAAPAIAQPSIPENLNEDPAKFCFVAGVVSAGIMERFNAGYSKEYLYADVNRMQQPQLRAFLNESVTVASQFSAYESEPVDIKQFARLRHKQCLDAMKPRRHEVRHADGTRTYLDN